MTAPAYLRSALAEALPVNVTMPLAIRVARQLKATDVIDVLADLFITRGTPVHIRSDNGPEFAAIAVKSWITGVGARTAYIEPGSPWENGYVESFNGKFRDGVWKKLSIGALS